MSTNCTDEALSNDIIKNSFLFVITYLWSDINIIQKPAQPHVPPPNKMYFKRCTIPFLCDWKKDFKENVYLWDGKNTQFYVRNAIF